MKVGFEVEISKESEEYLNIPKKYGYKKVKKIQPSDWLVLHMYPKEDTFQDGDLRGFHDALFFDLHIYDARHMEYKVVESRDGIDIEPGLDVLRIYTHKDGSTAIVFKPGVNVIVDIMQAVQVRYE